MAKAKIQITMDEDLLTEVDNYCDKNYMNRSWLISQALVQIINQQKMVDAISNISIAIRTCAEKGGQLDDKTKREMESFETLCKMYLGK